MIRVIIADDHRIVREGLKALLTELAPDMEVAGEAAWGREAVQLLDKLTADLVLMDIDMPGMNGIEATRLIKERFPRVKVLMLTMLQSEQFLADALKAGAQGCVLKSAGRKELLHAIRTVVGGEEYFSADVAKMLLGKMQSSPYSPAETSDASVSGGQAQAQQLSPAITRRELEVLRLIAQGYTNQQIGDMLFTSRRTVETHRKHLLEKTGANNTATLILYAASHSLLE